MYVSIYVCIYLFIYLKPPVLNSRWLKYQTTEIMSGMVIMLARELWTYQLGMSRWSVGWWPTSAGIRTSFHGGPSSSRSNVFWFVPGSPGCYLLPPPRRLGFCQSLFVCLSACLCVSKVTQKVLGGSFWNFEGMSGMAKTTSDSIFGVIWKESWILDQIFINTALNG